MRSEYLKVADFLRENTYLSFYDIVGEDRSVSFKVFNSMAGSDFIFSVRGLEGAIITVLGTEIESVINRQGTASLNNLPGGELHIEIREPS